LNNWKKTIISPDTLLFDALKVIDKEALRIALVVDEGNNLLGTLTDGDVRRALLKHNSLKIKSSLAMNKKPTTAPDTLSSIELDAIIQAQNLLAIPVVDCDGHLVDMHTLQVLTERRLKDNPVFIMAGGFGTRLKPLTDTCPKPMLNVGGKPILETILENFLEVGFRNFYFSTHYLPEVIEEYFGDGKKFGCSIKYIHEKKPLGTGGAIGLLPKTLPNLPIIMINGDILSKIDFLHLLEDHENKGAIATMCVKQYQYQIPYGVIKDQDGYLMGVDEKPVQSFFVNAGIYVFNPELLKYISVNEKINMPSLLMQRVKENEKVNIFPVHEYWLDIGIHSEFEKAKKDIINLGEG